MDINDRNFDDISHKFSQNIYGTTKGKIRQTVVWQTLETLLERFPTTQKLAILDAGGGQGQIACKLAKLGHHVTVCDISTQMLDLAKQHAESEKLNLNYLNCPIQAIDSYIPNRTFDLVICHAVLEWVENPQQLIEKLSQQLKPGGVLSLMFYNYYGLLFKTATLGNFGYTQSGLAKRKKKTLSPDYPRKPDDVYGWLADANFVITEKTGIRVFHDYLIDRTKQQSRFDELLELEKHYCKTDAFINIARYILVTAIQNTP